MNHYLRNQKNESNQWIFFLMQKYVRKTERAFDNIAYIISDSLSRNFTLRENWSYSEFFWSVFFRISSEYGDFPSKSSFSVQTRKYKD